MTPIENLELRNQIVKAKCRGKSDTAIAAEFGVGVGTVKSVVKAEFTARLATRSEMIVEHKLELDEMRRLVWERVTKKGDNWDRKDIELLLTLSNAQRKLFGLDAPTRLEVKNTDELTDEELAEECRRAGIETGLALPAKRVEEPVPDAEVIVTRAEGG